MFLGLSLRQQVKNQAYDAIIHVGDFAYDLHTNNGKMGDLFMQELEPIAANIPYQVVVGNHENDDLYAICQILLII